MKKVSLLVLAVIMLAGCGESKPDPKEQMLREFLTKENNKKEKIDVDCAVQLINEKLKKEEKVLLYEFVEAEKNDNASKELAKKVFNSPIMGLFMALPAMCPAK